METYEDLFEPLSSGKSVSFARYVEETRRSSEDGSCVEGEEVVDKTKKRHHSDRMLEL